MSRTRSSLAAVALLALLMLMSVAMPVAAQGGGRELLVANTEGAAVVSSDINAAAARRANGTISVIVKLASAPAYRDFQVAGGRDNRGVATSAAETRAAQLRAEQESFATAATALGGNVTNRFQFLLNAVVVEIAPDRVLSLAKIPGVVSIGPNRTYEREHTTAMPLIRASDVWEGSFTGGSYTGAGVTVAVIDEGIDYTHAHFGGNEDYSVNDPLVITDNISGFPPVSLPNTALGEMKVIGGYDFVGDDYNAAGTGSALIAVPDPDPIGCPYSHGTHVAGTVAGYGVDNTGETFAGDYTDGDALFPSYPNASTATWRIGPGSAPEAYLVSLRIFGCTGSVNTDILLASFEEAATETYLGEDVDVVNMSLGSAYGGTGPDDFMNGAQEALADMGIVVVASAGNSGDFQLVNGAPSSAKTTISVANVTDGAAIVDGQLTYVDPVSSATINIPAAKAVAMYTTAMPDPLSGGVILSNDGVNSEAGGSFTDGCSGLVGTYTGLWVIVDRGVCGFSVKVANVKLAGGLGAIIVNNAVGAPFGAGQTAGFDDQLPAVMVSLGDGGALKAAVGAGAVTATFDGGVGYALAEVALSASPSTSRGGILRGNDDLILKPNVAGIGTTVTSAGAGTNDLGYTISGTSMSSPQIAGGVALLLEALGDSADADDVANIKQRLMNTATTDIRGSDASALPYQSPQRVGAGLADFVNAINTDLVAYATDAPENTSLSFGYPLALVGTTPSIVKTITVENLSGSEMTLATAYSPRSDWGGAAFSVNPAFITVAANSSAVVNVTLSLFPSQANLNVGGDPLFVTTGKSILHEESGYVTLTPTSGSQTAIRVPVYAAPHITSDIWATEEVELVGDTGVTTIDLTGDGFDFGPDSNDHLSLTSAYTLLATSAEEEVLFWDADSSGTDDGDEELTDYGYADIQYVGAALTVVSAATTIVDVGIVMHDEWTTPRDMVVEIYVDLDNNGTDEYVWYYSTGVSDAYTVTFVSFAEGAALSFGTTLNYAHGAAVDSMLFKNNVMSFPVTVKSPSFNSALRPNYVSGPIGIDVVTYQRDSDFTFPIDVVETVYDPTEIQFVQTFARNLYPALDGVQIPFIYDVTDSVALPEILTLHHQNDDMASRAQITSLSQTTGEGFELISPADGTVFRDADYVTGARWTELTGATSYTFTLTQLSRQTGIGTDAAGDQTVVTGTAAADADSITCAVAVCEIDLSAVSLEDGTYSWFVTSGAGIEADNNPFGFIVETNDHSLGIIHSDGTTAVVEGGATDSYTVTLNSKPSADVTVTLAGTQVTTDVTSLTFTNADWDTPQTVTVTAADDSIDETDPHAGAVSYTFASADGNYDGLVVADTAVSVSDNDVAGVAVVETDASTAVTEGGATDTYTVALTSEPTADVTVTLAGTQVTTDVTTLTFTSADWNTPQTVTVTAVDDLVAEANPHAGSVGHTFASADTFYAAVAAANVAVSVTDNDTAAVTITESDGSTAVTEGTTSDTYTVVLTSEPTADVVITLTGTQVTTDVATLTFTSANWNVAQTVTVSATDEGMVEGVHMGSVSSSIASTDTVYAAVVVGNVAVTITDGVSVNLILNGSFETVGTAANKAESWTGPAVRKITAGVAQDGVAFLQVPDNKKAKQTLTNVNQPALDFFVAGDVLNLNFFTQKGKGKLVTINVTYADATTEKCNIPAVVNTPPGNDWEAEGFATCELNGPVSKIIIVLKHAGGTQTAATRYDNVTLTVQSPGRVIESLPLPASPDGFRGNN